MGNYKNRSIGTYQSGTIPQDFGGDQVSHLIGVITGSLQSFISNGEPAWQLHDLIDPASASFDAVFHSVGDRNVTGSSGDVRHVGDTEIFFRITRTLPTAIYLTVYQDWSIQSSNSSNSQTANPGGVRPAAQTTNTDWTSLDNNDEIEYWAGVNEYEFVFLFKQIGGWWSTHIIHPELNAPPGEDGRARLLTATTGSGVVTVELDQNMSGSKGQTGCWQPGQYIWIVPSTPDTDTAADASIDIVQVNYVTSGVGEPSKAELATTTKTFPSGSLLGIEPVVVYEQHPVNLAAAGGNTWQDLLYGVNRPDGGYSSISSQIADYESMANTLTTIGEASLDPNFYNYYVGFPPVISADQTSYYGVRGRSRLIAFFADGAQTDGDRLIVGGAKFFFTFPSIGYGNTGFPLALGPFDIP